MRIANERNMVMQAIAQYAPGTIRMQSGEYINPLQCRPEEIHIEDIAQGLAYTFRWCGQRTGQQICVAEHSINVMQRVRRFSAPGVVDTEDGRQKLRTALLHDASEAYLGDMPKPIKNSLPDYVKAEKNLMQVIAKRFDLIWPMPDSVKLADGQELEQEWDLNPMAHKREKSLSPEAARLEFLRLFEKLKA